MYEYKKTERVLVLDRPLIIKKEKLNIYPTLHESNVITPMGHLRGPPSREKLA